MTSTLRNFLLGLGGGLIFVALYNLRTIEAGDWGASGLAVAAFSFGVKLVADYIVGMVADRVKNK